MDAVTCRQLVQRYYDELWNAWRLELVDEILAEDLHFRGSLGTQVDGREAFRAYLLGMRQALPDLHHEVELIIAEDDAAAARLLYTGTHEGNLLGLAGDGHRLSYQGATFFRMEHELIAELWTLGDMSTLRRQLMGTAPT